jgi:hypothetical protein
MTEVDPFGKAPSDPGAKLDAGKTRAWLMASGFRHALLAVADVTTYGAAKYTPGGWVSVPDGQQRYMDAALRHLLADGSLDEGSELPHLAHAAWNVLAALELRLAGGSE